MTMSVRGIALTIGIASLTVLAVRTMDHHDDEQLTVHAQGGAYWYHFEQSDDGADYAVIIDHYGKSSSGENYSAYKNASDARIDGWSANPSSAPTINGRPVALTFEHPLNAAQLASVVSAGNIDLKSFVLAGQTEDGRKPTMWENGPSVPWNLVGSPIIDPGCSTEPAACTPDIYYGVLQADGIISTGGVASLAALKSHADVYLADSTGIQVLSEVQSTYPTYYTADMTVSMPSAMWTNTGEVSFQ